MKSQAIRAFVLLALIAVAHQIKPFTTTNLIAFAGASLRSLTELLPESALRKASVLAAVVGRAWQKNDALTLPAANLLAVSQTTDASACDCKTKRRTRTAAALPVRVVALAETEEEVERADEPVISWQSGATEEAPASEKIELPPAPVPTWSTLALPNIITTTVKRDACEIPSPTTDAATAPTMESLPETKPMNESETAAPAKLMRSGRPVRSSEIDPVEIEPAEMQPIVFPRASTTPIRLLYLKATKKSASKC